MTNEEPPQKDKTEVAVAMTYVNKIRPESSTETDSRYDDATQDMSVDLDRTGVRAILPEAARTRFADKALEGVYRAHAQRMTWDTLVLVPLFSALLCLVSCLEDFLVYTDNHLPHLVVLGSCFLLDVAMVIVVAVNTSGATLRCVLPYALYALMAMQLFLDLGLQMRPISPSEDLTWVCFVVYAAFTTLPIRYSRCFILACCVAVTHLALTAVMAATSHYSNVFALPNQVIHS
jgi:hypothetical protein